MRRRILLLVPYLGPWLAARQGNAQREQPRRLPDGRLQSEAILKAEHERSLEDAAKLHELATSLKKELEEQDYHVLSVSALRKTEEIERLARRIRSRLRRF